MKKSNQKRRKCCNPACRRRAEHEVCFCGSCLSGILDGKVNVFEMGLVRRKVWYVAQQINPCKGKFFIFDDFRYGKVLMFHRSDAAKCVRLLRRCGLKPKNLIKEKFPNG